MIATPNGKQRTKPICVLFRTNCIDAKMRCEECQYFDEYFDMLQEYNEELEKEGR